MSSRRLGGEALAVAVRMASGGADRTASHRLTAWAAATTATLARRTGKRHLGRA